MSCPIEVIKQNSLKIAREKFIGNNKSYKEADGMVYIESTFNKPIAKIWKDVEKSIKDVTAWALEEFKSVKFTENWIETSPLGDSIINIYFKFPKILEDAYRLKKEQETAPTQEVKPGVQELFDSNPELANAVYEAAGFKEKLSSITPKVSITNYRTMDDKSKKDAIDGVEEAQKRWVEEEIAEFYEAVEQYNKNLDTFSSKGVNKGKATIDDVIDETLGIFRTIQMFPKFSNLILPYINDIQISIDSFGRKEGYAIYKAKKDKKGQAKEMTYENLFEVVDKYMKTSQITPQQKQQALQLYSQYLEQGGTQQDIEGFKEFVGKEEVEETQAKKEFDLKTEVEKMPEPFAKPEFIKKTTQKELLPNVSEKRSIVISKMQDILKQLGITLEETDKIFTKQKQINSLNSLLSTDIPEKEKEKIQKQIQDLEKEGYNEDVIVIADTLNGVLQFVKGQLTEDNFTEDVVHFIVDILEQKDPQLYNQFKKDIWKFSIYQDTLNEYKELPAYKNEDGSVNFDKIKKEAIAKVLTAHLLGDPTGGNFTTFANIWETSKNVIKKLFGKVSKSSIYDFQEFSKKLLSDYIEEKDRSVKLSGEEFYAVKTSKNIQKRLSFTRFLYGVLPTSRIKPESTQSEKRDYFESFRDKISKTTEKNQEGEEEEIYLYEGKKSIRATSIASYKDAYKDISQSDVAKIKRDTSLKAGNIVHGVMDGISKRYIDNNTGKLRDIPLDKPENSEYYLVENAENLTLDTLDVSEKQVNDVIYKGKNEVTSKKAIKSNSYIVANNIKFKASLVNYDIGTKEYVYALTPIDLYQVLEFHLSKILKSYPEGTLFSTELPVINEQDGYAGTLDFIAYLPDGKIDILDWKTTDLFYTNVSGERVKRENVSPFNEIYWKNQISLYKNAIYSHMPFFVKEKTGLFGRTMAIPIGLDIKRSLIDKNKKYSEENATFLIQKIKFADITNVFEIPEDDFALVPVPTPDQTTGIEALDKEITKLWALYERILKFPLREGETLAKKNLELEKLRAAIKELQIKHSATKFLNVFNESYNRFKELKNKNLSYLKDAIENESDLTDEQKEDLSDYLSDVYQGVEFLTALWEFPNVISELEITKTSSDYDKELIKYTSSISTSAKTLAKDLLDIQEQLVDNFAKLEGMKDYLNLDIQKTQLEKWINSTRSWMSREEKSIALAGKIYNSAAFLAKKETDEYFSNDGKFKTVKENLENWSKKAGISLKEVYKYLIDEVVDKSDKKPKLQLASKISKEWYVLFEKKREEFQIYYNELAREAEEKNLKGEKARNYIEDAYKSHVESFFNENYDIKEYLKELQELFEKEKEKASKLSFSSDKLKDEAERKKYLFQWRERYNVFRNPRALYNDFNPIKKYFNQEKWYSEKFKFISKNQPLLDTYELFYSINLEALRAGMLSDVTTRLRFIPKVLLPHSLLGILKWLVLGEFNRVSDLVKYKFDPYGEKEKAIYIDPLTGKEIKQIAIKYKFISEDDQRELSQDLFSVFSLWKSHIIKYKHIKNIEDKLLSVQMVESLKRTQEIIPYNKKIKTTSNQIINQSKLETVAKTEETDQILNDYLDKYIYSQGNDRNTFQRLLEFLRDWAQAVHIGMKPSSWISNYMGANFNAKLLNDKWMSAEDYDEANLIQTGTTISFISPDVSKKALFLIKHFATRIEKETDNSALEGLVEKQNSLITDVAYFGYKFGENIIQDNIAISYFLNTTIKNGRLVNISDFIKSKYPSDITNLSQEERVKISKKIYNEIKEMKEKDSLFNYVKEKGESYEIQEISKKETIKYYNLIKNKIESSLGGIDPNNSSSLKLNFIASLIMMYKNWVPRTLLSRFESFRLDPQTSQYTWGRTNAFTNILFSNYFLNAMPTFAKTLGETMLRGIPFYYKSETLTNLTKTNIYATDWVVEASKKLYFEKLEEFAKSGKRLDLTQDQFAELFANSIYSQMREFAILTLFTAVIMTISAGSDDDKNDDWFFDPIANNLGIRNFIQRNKQLMKIMSRILWKTNRDLWFSYSGEQLVNLFQDVSPIIPFTVQITQLPFTFIEEVFGRLFGEESKKDKIHPLHETVKVTPYVGELDFILLNMSKDYQKTMGVKEPPKVTF